VESDHEKATIGRSFKRTRNNTIEETPHLLNLFTGESSSPDKLSKGIDKLAPEGKQRKYIQQNGETESTVAKIEVERFSSTELKKRLELIKGEKHALVHFFMGFGMKHIDTK
jgi:hypothetical protein